MNRLSNRVRKLETVNGVVDLDELQRYLPGVDVTMLSRKHQIRLAEIHRDNPISNSLASMSNRDLRDSMALSILLTAHATNNEAAMIRAIAALDDGQEFTTDELKLIMRNDPSNQVTRGPKP